jgi:hypothetical protein
MRKSRFPGYCIATFTTTLAATATDGVEVPLGWSEVANCHISHYTATSDAGGTSWQYDRSTGILTLYGVTTGLDEATVKVTVLGVD